LKIASLKSELVDQEQLLEVGGISPAKFEKTKQELTLAEKDLETIQEKNAIRLEQLATEEQGLRLQIQIQEKELESRKEILSRMSIRALSDGIILEVNGTEGEKVNKDHVLVRMSDLSTYKIRASIEDNMDDAIKTGRDVFALLDRDKLDGKIGNINPVIKDRKIEFDVFLARSDYPKLRPNLSVQLQVVIARRDSVPRIRKGTAVEKGRNHEVYKVEAERAVLINIETGLKGDEYCEIRSGIEVGDQIVTSDISSIRKLEEIVIN
jgi:HlyD family secretion protein